ncbi:MAG: NnrU family protein [Casimicrobiaceae bacterium]
MTPLVAGLVLFLGVHCIRIFADGWRSAQVARLGEGKWKGIYSLLSGIGLVLLVWGYGQARLDTIALWHPPLWTRHVAALLTLPAFVLMAAGNMPGTRIKAALGHPFVLGVKLWAFAHLLANGTLADVVLFGSFLAWAIVDFASLRRRDRANGTVYPPGTLARDALATAIGVVAWVVFAFWLHGLLIGVRPFG